MKTILSSFFVLALVCGMANRAEACIYNEWCQDLYDKERLASLPVGSTLMLNVSGMVPAGETNLHVDSCTLIFDAVGVARQMSGQITITTNGLPSVIMELEPTPWGDIDVPWHQLMGNMNLDGKSANMALVCDDYYVKTIGDLRKIVAEFSGTLTIPPPSHF